MNIKFLKSKKRPEVDENTLILNEAYLYLHEVMKKMQIDSHFDNKNNLIFIERIYSYLKFWERKIEEKGLKIVKYEDEKEFGYKFIDGYYPIAKLSFNARAKEVSFATLTLLKEYYSFYQHTNYLTIKFVNPHNEIILVKEKYEHYIDSNVSDTILLNTHLYRYSEGDLITEEHYNRETLESKKCFIKDVGYKSYEEAKYLLNKKGEDISKRAYERAYDYALKLTKERR